MVSKKTGIHFSGEDSFFGGRAALGWGHISKHKRNPDGGYGIFNFPPRLLVSKKMGSIFLERTAFLVVGQPLGFAYLVPNEHLDYVVIR